MLIKGVTKKGDAIPLSPAEALTAAIGMGLSQKNNSEYVYWLGSKTVKTEAFQANTQPDNVYDAFSEGVCSVGKTRVLDDKFFDAKPYRYKIHYKSSKDDFGLPHVSVESFDLTPAETNPAKMVGEVNRENVSLNLSGEIEPTNKGGRVTARRAR